MALFHVVKYLLISLLGLNFHSDVAPPTVPSSVCSIGEVYRECHGGYCGIERTCSYKEEAASCTTDSCESACVCGEGLVRRQDGTCVPEMECEAPPTDLPRAGRCQTGACERHCKEVTGGRQSGRCDDNGNCYCT